MEILVCQNIFQTLLSSRTMWDFSYFRDTSWLTPSVDNKALYSIQKRSMKFYTLTLTEPEQKWEGLLGSCMSSGVDTICIAPMRGACTHWNHLWDHPWEQDLSGGGAELAAQPQPHSHPHTHERLSSHWSASLHPTARVSEGSAAALCSRGLETLEWAIFSPPYFYFWAGYRRSTASLIFHCFPTNWFPASAASAAPASLPLVQKQAAK